MVRSSVVTTRYSLKFPSTLRDRVEDVDEHFFLRVDREAGQVRADLRPLAAVLVALGAVLSRTPSCRSAASPVLAMIVLELLDHLLPVGAGQSAAEGEQLLRALGEFLVRVRRRAPSAGRARACRTGACPSRRRRGTPSPNPVLASTSRSAAGRAAGGRSFSLPTTAAPTPFAFDCASASKMPVDERGRRLRRDRGEQSPSRPRRSPGRNSMICCAAASAVGVASPSRRRAWRMRPCVISASCASRPFTPQVEASLRSRPRDAAGSFVSKSADESCSTSSSSFAVLLAGHPAARPLTTLSAISARRASSSSRR